MQDIAKFIGEILFYVIVALLALAVCTILICVILLAVQACLVLLGEITPMLGVY